MLTIKQKKLLDYIKSYYQDKDLFPTFDEMKDSLSIKSKSGIYKLLSSLEDKGYIKKTPHKARAIELNDVRKSRIETDKTNLAETGDIVVALIDENEVTLKKFRSFKNSIALEPSNKNFKTRIFGKDRVTIQGKLVGLIRKF